MCFPKDKVLAIKEKRGEITFTYEEANLNASINYLKGNETKLTVGNLFKMSNTRRNKFKVSISVELKLVQESNGELAEDF